MGSNYVRAGDLKNILGSSFRDEDIEGLISEADLNGDGRLDYSEFAKYIRANRASLTCEQSADDVNAAGGLPNLLTNREAPFRNNSVQKKAGSDANVAAKDTVLMETTNSKQPPACCTIQ